MLHVVALAPQQTSVPALKFVPLPVPLLYACAVHTAPVEHVELLVTLTQVPEAELAKMQVTAPPRIVAATEAGTSFPRREGETKLQARKPPPIIIVMATQFFRIRTIMLFPPSEEPNHTKHTLPTTARP